MLEFLQNILQNECKPTSLSEVRRLGACSPVSVTVTIVRRVSASKDHEALVGEAQLDITIQVGATPESIAKGCLAATHLLSNLLGTLLSSQAVNVMDPAGP